MKICLVQGPFSPLFTSISKELVELGHDVYRYSFCSGDEAIAKADKYSEVIRFRGLPCEWADSFSSDLSSSKFDLVLGHGDCHFYNEVAFRIAKSHGVDVYVTEEGYFRPEYITLEKGGVNANSSMMTELDLEEEVHGSVTPVSELTKVSASLFKRGIHCTNYYFANLIGKNKFPFYKHRRSAGAVKEVVSWGKSACTSLKGRLVVDGQVTDIVNSNVDFYLVPLQVFCDSQIVRHSSYSDMESFIKDVMESFVKSAPQDTKLIFKHHPYCLGFSDYTKVIDYLTGKFGLEDRILYLRGGHLPTLLKSTKGVITINSTVGLNALHHNVPTFVAGSAFFDKGGITFQGSLDDFWSSDFKPCPEKVRRLTLFVKQKALVNASLYSNFEHSAKAIVGSVLNVPKQAGLSENRDI